MTDFRITFSKTGPLVFISHLDLAHTFVRAMNRALIPLRYSEGFNPHPKLAFALPLSVGMAGENEMCDVGLKTDMGPDELMQKLISVMPEYITIKKVKAPGKKFKEVETADYRITLSGIFGICDKIAEFSKKDSISIIKRTKSGEKETDIKKQIVSLSSAEDKNGTTISLRVDASPDSYLNPDYVLKAMESDGILCMSDCAVVRTSINIKK